MKKPCYNISELNPTDDPTCIPGNQWTPYAQKLMAGDLSQFNSTIKTVDNFHVVWKSHPGHFAHIN